MSMRLEYCKLGEVIHITSGKECPPENKTENSSFPIRGATGIIGYSKKPLYERPIILVGRVGAGLLSGMSGILNRAENPCWPSDNTLVIIPKEEDDFDYIEYCLRYSEIYPYVSGSSQPLLTQTALRLLEIPWPSRETRHMIGNNGRLIDQLLLMNKNIMNISQEISSALFRSWFIDFDPVKAKAEGKLPYGMNEEIAALFPNSFEDSELGPIPTGWNIGKIGDIANVKSGYAFKSKDFVFDSKKKVLKIKDLKGNGKIITTTLASIDEVKTSTNRVQFFKLEKGDIVVAMSGNTTGKIGIMPPLDNEIYLNQRVGKFFLKEKKINQFLYFFLISGNYEENFLRMGYGSAQPNINPSQIENIRIIIPPMKIIDNFIRFSDSMFGVMLDNDSAMKKIVEIRNLLLPRLMSGELSVS